MRVVECGPGSGRMMKDMTVIWKTDPFFWENCIIRFVDKFMTAPHFNSFHESPVPQEGFFFVVGNEFLDALPIQQYVVKDDGTTYPRSIVKSDYGYSFEEHEGKIYEECPEAIGIVQRLNLWHAQCKGLTLFIDYGDVIDKERFGDTLQAVHENKKVSIFFKPGETDLSHHVDFFALQQASKFLCRIQTQRDFLLDLGLEEWLKEIQNHADVSSHRLSCVRLLGEMGSLFKVFSMRTL